VLPHFLWLQGAISWKQFRAARHEPNVLERDYQLKRALGFGDKTFTRVRGLMPGRALP
jgi:hypothetical protein